ncbi:MULTISPECIES: alpha/beta hydrolase [unclassified Actinomyces]|uniref:alpha/beta hydrolase family protein n=1 Tax=unclassified Actinomyces TaxID=2609248 RepID=UPI0020181CC2|nr:MULTISPECIES: alpha/beta hydrolase [unclassified Actinomyces]MCL3777814.1 alpha/beta hydrolase [Actinomyces sp. AC-20-1]MCL3790431.1 alpha/beta hydrolase [Actinomyces sp. 187325]MCL3792708.1 alpha/beta hydrolase [Actinomyces sp. 186855]MCL3795190.1 alpha/beta hydrolase [Actinomyces sp. 217892]
MSEVRIDTSRGVTLAGTLMLPDGAAGLDIDAVLAGVDAGIPAPERAEGVIVLAHDFLTDRHGLDHRLDALAAAYRQAGWATLQFDFSGLGASDDDVVTLAGEVEDLQAVTGWLEVLGYRRTGVHANGFGATATLLARPQNVQAVVVVGAVVGPQSILWENVFSPDQLDELAAHGLTRLVDDNPNAREWDVLSKQTLADVSLQSPERTMEGLPWPVLMLHGALTDEFPDSAAAATEGFTLLRDGSQLVQVRAENPQEAQEQVGRLGREWFERRLR